MFGAVTNASVGSGRLLGVSLGDAPQSGIVDHHYPGDKGISSPRCRRIVHPLLARAALLRVLFAAVCREEAAARTTTSFALS